MNRNKNFAFLISLFMFVSFVLSPAYNLVYADDELELEISDEFVPSTDEIDDSLVFQEAPMNPDFNKVRGGYNDENFGLNVDPFKPNTNYDAVEGPEGALRADYFPSKYDLRNENRVTPMRDQGPNGSCWAFATYGSAESTTLPRYNKDFSEKHLRNTHGFDWGPDDGGTRNVSAAYLSRWSGPVSEANDPYNPYGFTSPLNLPRDMDVDKILYIPDVRNAGETGILKRAIMKYGAAYTTVVGNNSYTNFYTMGHFNNGYGYANHAVTIVGWDDNYSRSNFRMTPRGDGAWIVKNSWGRNWGNLGGYYYVSYYDSIIAHENTVFLMKPKSNNKSVWYYDDFGMTSSYGNGQTGYFANVFGPTREDSQINEVGFFVPSNNARYEVYVNTDYGSNNGLNNRVKVAEGSFEYAGYYTVPLSRPQFIRRGSYFAPIIKITTPGYSYPIPVESYVRGYTSRAKASYGQSYISYDGQRWTDMTNQKYNTNVCVKAFTSPAGYNPNPDPDPEEDKKVKQISLTADKTNIAEGDEVRINANIVPSDAKNKNLSWSSTNSRVASVRGGLVRGLSEGRTTIYAKSTDGSNVSASINIYVKKVVTDEKVTSLSLSPANKTIKVGESYVISPKIYPASATNKALEWSTSNESAATVSNGVVRGVGPGKATIYARTKDGSDILARAYVSVDGNSSGIKIRSFSISPTQSTIKVGEKLKIEGRFYPTNATNKTLRWTSSNNNVARVNNGNVEGVGKGYTVITARTTDGSNLSASAKIYVEEESNNEYDLILSTSLSSEKVNPGKTIRVTANVRDGQRRTLKYATVTLSFDKKDGSKYSKSFYTDYYGNAYFNLNQEIKEPGVYNAVVRAEGGRYNPTEENISFEVLDNRPDFTTTVSLNKKSIDKDDSISLFIKTFAGRYTLSNCDVDIEITLPNGVVHRNTGNTGYYGQTTYVYTPGNSSPYGEYKYKITAKRYGYRASVAEGTFTVEHVENPYDLRISLSPDKESYQLGERSITSIGVRYYTEQVYSYAKCYINVKGPNGFNYDLVKNADYYGRTNVYLQPDESMGAGKYYITVSATSNYYKGSNTVEVEFFDGEEPEPDPEPDPDVETIYEMIETDQAERMINENAGNSDFVVLDVRTKAEYMESHIDGVVHHDYYQPDHREFLEGLDRNKTYLLYCRTQVRSGATAEIMKELGFNKIYWMNGGMTKWLKESRPAIFPEYNKAIDVEITTNKPSYRAGETVNINFAAKDLDDNYLRKADVSYEIVDSRGTVLKSEELVMGNTGEYDTTFVLPRNASGKYRIVGKGTKKNYQSGKGLALFNIGSNDKFISFDSRKARGDFNHLKKTDIEYESLEKYYGKNLLKYSVKDKDIADREIEDLVDTGKNSVLVFGYPGCGPCVDMIKAMKDLPHEQYNYLEIITSVEEDVKSSVDFTKNVLNDIGAMNLFPHFFYDANDYIWASRMGFLTTPNTVFLDKQGRVVNIAGALTKDELYRIYEKTFGEKIEEEDVEPEFNATINASLDKKAIDAGESVKITARVLDLNGRYVRNAELKIRLIDPRGVENFYKAYTNYYGTVNYPISIQKDAEEGGYTIICEYEDSNYKAEPVELSFEVLKAEEPQPDDTSLSYSDRYRNGEFNHLSNSDLASKLRSVYGKYVGDYTLTNLNGYNVRVSSLMDGKRPTVIALGYPSCGGCQNSWRSLVNIDKSKFNMVEAMTSGGASEIRNTLSRLGLSRMEPYFHYNARTLFNVINSNYVPVLLFLDADGNIANVSYFESNSDVIRIVNQIEGTKAVN